MPRASRRSPTWSIMLRKMGAQISGDETSTLRIQGVEKLHGCEHSVIPDRIEAGTFLVAGAITGGDLTIENCAPEHLGRRYRQDAAGRSAHRHGRQNYASRAAQPKSSSAPI